MAHTSARRIVGLWIVVSILTLLLTACGSSEEAADAPQEEPATAVEMEAENATSDAAVCVVPDVVGFDQANAERMVQGVGLVPVRSAEFSAEVPEGHVIAQEPAGDTRLDPCAGDVSLVVSLGAGDMATGETPAGTEDTPETTMPASTASGRVPITPDNAAGVINIATLEGHTDGAGYVAFSPDGRLLASGLGDGTVKVWDVTTGAEIATLEGHTDVVGYVAFSPDGTLLASGSLDQTVKLWNMTTHTETATLNGHTDSVIGVVFSPNGTVLASGSWDSTVKLWSLTTFTETATLGHADGVLGIAFSSDGALLASGLQDATVKLWDIATGREIATLEGHTNVVIGVAFNPDGSLLASASYDGTVRLWDVDTGVETVTLEGHTDWGRIYGVAFSPDGSLLASTDSTPTDGMVKLWDVTTGTEIAMLDGHTDSAFGVAFSPDGALLASASQDETVKIWAVPTEAEVATIKRTREAIVGKWMHIRDTNGEIERESWRPDYDYVFFPDGTMVSFDTMGPGVFEYIIVGDAQLRVDDGDNVGTGQVTIAGDRMTWMVGGEYEIELERVGSIDLTAIERIRERTREAIAGKWIMVRGPEGVIEREPDMPDYDYAFSSDGTLTGWGLYYTETFESSTFESSYDEYGSFSEYIFLTGSYDVVDDTHMYVTTSNEDGNEESMVMQFSLSGDRMTWVMNGMELELERIGPVD